MHAKGDDLGVLNNETDLKEWAILKEQERKILKYLDEQKALAHAKSLEQDPQKAPAQPPVSGLPTTDAERKALPVFTGVLMYFPNALLEVARVSKLGNDQHNPGEPLHWAREKSTDQMNTALRHMMDHGMGNHYDGPNEFHLAKSIWRLLAELQLTIERKRRENANRI